MIECHACGEHMTLDEWGHPVHPGRCRGPLRPHPVECPWCHDQFTGPHALQQHHRRCTQETPTRRRKTAERTVCERCQLRHTPRCSQSRWPVAPLVEAVGTTRLYEVLGVERTQVRRLEVSGLPTFQADRWALAFGLHPAQVWGWDWFADALPAWWVDGECGGWRPAWLAGESDSTFGSTDNKEKAA